MALNVRVDYKAEAFSKSYIDTNHAVGLVRETITHQSKLAPQD